MDFGQQSNVIPAPHYFIGTFYISPPQEPSAALNYVQCILSSLLLTTTTILLQLIFYLFRRFLKGYFTNNQINT